MNAQRRPLSFLRYGTVVSAICLAGTYVWFRSAHAEAPQSMPGSKGGIIGANSPAYPGQQPTILPGSKSFTLTPPASQPAAPSTQEARQRMFIYGSKSARIMNPGDVPAGTITITSVSPATQPTITVMPGSKSTSHVILPGDLLLFSDPPATQPATITVMPGSKSRGVFTPNDARVLGGQSTSPPIQSAPQK